MKKYFYILGKLCAMALQRMLEYRKDVLIWMLVSLGWTLFSLLFYEIIFGQTQTIAGWSKRDVYVLVATFLIIDNMTWSFFWRNMQMYVQSIFNGTLDFVLTRPIDNQFMLSFNHISITGVPRLIIGLYLLFTFAPQVSVGQVLLYVALVAVSLFTIYSLWFFTATFTFWVERLDNIVEIVPTLRRIWSLPSDVYTGPVSAMLTVVIPLGLISTTPTRILLGQYPTRELGIFLGFSTLLFLAGRWFFKYSIRRYSSAGS